MNSEDAIKATYRRLVEAAADLNAASDELAETTNAWDKALGSLNLGIVAWVDVKGEKNGDRWWDRSIGYAKVKSGWHIAIRTREGSGLTTKEDLVAFADAPRWMRIETAAYLPMLLDAIWRQTLDTTKAIRDIYQAEALKALRKENS